MERLSDVLRHLGLDLTDQGPRAAPPEEGPELEEPACSHCGGFGFVTREVPVGHPDFGKAFPCQCRAEAMARKRQEQLERMSNLGPLRRLTFETLIPEGRKPETAQHRERFRRAVAAARRFAERPEGWLLLAGGPGCGKTHLAAAVANARLAQGEPVLFLVVPDLLDHLRAAFAPSAQTGYDELFETVRNHPLLVLDDLGAQSSTPWAQEKLFQLLNARYTQRLPTILTTNRQIDELDERLRVRLTDPDLTQICWVEPPRTPALLRFSALPPLIKQMRFETFQWQRRELTAEQRESLRLAFEAARRFALTPAGWLILHGSTGCGKTHLAAAIRNAVAEADRDAMFVSVPDLLDHLRSTFGPESTVTYDELFETVRTAPLLILDDLGSQSGTAWAQEKLYQLFNYRYNGRLATVVTTNLPLEALEPRLASRLRDSALSQVVEITAPDYRRAPGDDRPRQETGAQLRERGPRWRG